MKEQCSIWCPASVSNLNVGFDALGFCLSDSYDLMHFKRVDRPGIHLGAISGYAVPSNPSENIACVAAQSLLNKYKGPEIGIELSIDKRIKPGSGVGSSAASAAGAVIGVKTLLGVDFSDQELLESALDGEQIASGARHADNIAPALFGKFCLIITQENHRVLPLSTGLDLHYVVAHQQIEIKTSESRGALPVEIPLKTAVKQWSSLAGFTAALLTDDLELMRHCAKDYVAEPVRKSSIPHFESLKASALDTGAFIFGISGSGPSVFALCEGATNAAQVAQSLTDFLQEQLIEFKIYSGEIHQKGAHEIL